MAAMTNFLENKLIDFLFRGQALGLTNSTAAAGSGPTNIFVGLLTAAPTDSTAGTEVTGGGYARDAVPATLAEWSGTQGAGTTTASTGTSGTTSNNNPIVFPSPTANWGTIVAVGLYDAITGGNLLAYATLTAPKVVNSGDAPPTFAAGALAFRIDD